MEDKTKKGLAAGVIAVGGAIGVAALNELILADKAHAKKETEIDKLEKETDKYMKKIGAYEPFNIEKGVVTPDDSKLVNLLTRAVGVAFTNSDVFSRNKSNIRTFPFIISNNSSISAATEVELRKYYEITMASQVANLINHTVFAAENILNVKDDSMRSVDKIVNNIFSRSLDLTDMGNSLQKGIRENILFEQNGKILCLNEEYTNNYPTLDQYLNDYQRVIKTYSTNAKDRENLIKSMEKIRETRTALITDRKSKDKMDYSPTTVTAAPIPPAPKGVATVTLLNSDEKTTIQNISDLFSGAVFRPFDGIESEETVLNYKAKVLVDFKNFKGKLTHGNKIEGALEQYLNNVSNYHTMLSRGITIMNNNNFNDPSEELSNSDPYFRLLNLPRVQNYDNASALTMKMFKNSNTLKIKLEMAAALLISTEILPFEFIDYATNYLGLPMTKETKISIGLEYGEGTARLPFRFMGNFYIMSDRQNVVDFYGIMRPEELADKAELVKQLTRNQLRANNWGFFDFLRNRKKLEDRWTAKHGDVIDKRLAALYASSADVDDKAKINNIDRQIKDQSAKMHASLNKNIDDIVTKSAAGKTAGGDIFLGKQLSILGANGARVHKIIEDRLKNKIIDLFSVQDVDKSIEYFLADPSKRTNNNYNPTDTFMPNLMQTRKIMQSMMNSAFETDVTTILTEDLILALTENTLNEASSPSNFIFNMTRPERVVTYKEVTKDPIEYVLPAYTKGRSLLYGSTEIDLDQFKTRKVGEPIWIKVTFSDKINSMKTDVVDNDFTTVIGIKSEVSRVDEKDMAKVLKDPNISNSELAEIFKDQRDQTLGLLSKIANENDLRAASLNAVLVVSLNEATSNIAAKSSESYINNPKLATNLKKTYNLTSICLVDSIAEEYFIMEENGSSWSRLPFAELRTGANNSELKAIASMVNQRR